jgi:integrase
MADTTQKGQLVWRRTGWLGRWWATVDGERIRVARMLGTDNKAVARRKLARLIAEGNPTPEAVKAPETVDGYAKAWLDGREGRGLRSADYERRHYDRIWKPAIGAMPLAAVKSQHIREVLEAVANGQISGPKTKRYSKATLVHIRDTALRLFRSAWRDEVIVENPVDRVALPDVNDDRPEKARSILTDEEFGMLVQCPDVDTEIKLMALMARTIGGMRAGDLVALTWDAFDPEFTTCTFVRRKTRRKNRKAIVLEVPVAVRPFLAAWQAHHEAKRDKALPEPDGPKPVFPVRKGKRAGGIKKSTNTYAPRLRRALLVAGVTRHELHNETTTTLPADFHSCRRAFATALARAGVNEQTAMILTGHADAKVHRRYLNALTLKAMPEAAVPSLDPAWALQVPTAQKPENESSVIYRAGEGIRTLDVNLGKVALYH